MSSVTSRTDSASLVMSFIHTQAFNQYPLLAAIRTVPWLGPVPATSLPQAVLDVPMLWEVMLWILVPPPMSDCMALRVDDSPKGTIIGHVMLYAITTLKTFSIHAYSRPNWKSMAWF